MHKTELSIIRGQHEVEADQFLNVVIDLCTTLVTRNATCVFPL